MRSKAGAPSSVSRRGQLSLEALISFAAILSAISILVFSAQQLGGRLSFSAGESAERYSLSYSALCLDEGASSMGFSAYHLQSSSLETSNLILKSRKYPHSQQRLFYNASSQGGPIYGGTTGFEPI